MSPRLRCGSSWETPSRLTGILHTRTRALMERMDAALDQMSPAELIAEVRKLRQAIREHRDTSEHDMCWHHPALWGLLPEKTDPLPVVPEWPQFMRGCVRYRESLDTQAPDAPRTNEPFRGSSKPAPRTELGP